MKDWRYTFLSANPWNRRRTSHSCGHAARVLWRFIASSVPFVLSLVICGGIPAYSDYAAAEPPTVSLPKVPVHPRTPLVAMPNPPPGVKVLPLALVDAVIVPPERTDLLIMPDERAYADDGHWAFLPSSRIVPPTEILLLALGYAGLNMQQVSSLASARVWGAKFAIVVLIKSGKVLVLEQVPGMPTGVTGVEARVEAQAAIVEAGSSRIVWQGPLSAQTQDQIETPFTDDYSQLQSEVGLGLLESRLQPMRVLLTQCYYHLAATMVTKIGEILSREIAK